LAFQVETRYHQASLPQNILTSLRELGSVIDPAIRWTPVNRVKYGL
jgi:hypothetical protein